MSKEEKQDKKMVNVPLVISDDEIKRIDLDLFSINLAIKSVKDLIIKLELFDKKEDLFVPYSNTLATSHPSIINKVSDNHSLDKMLNKMSHDSTTPLKLKIKNSFSDYTPINTKV